MATYKGYSVEAGVKWKVTKETITITCYPSKTSVPYKKYTKTWENYCPFCKKKGILDCHGTGNTKKGWKWSLDGQIYCIKCGADFCGVTGKDAATHPRATLRKASSKTSDSSTSMETTIQDKKEALAELKKDYKSKSTPKKDFKITIPPLKGIGEGRYIELAPPLVKTPRTFFIGAIDTSQSDMTLTLYDGLPEVGTEYSEKTGTTKTVTVEGADSAIAKRIMLKGKELKTIGRIKNFLRKDGGSGGYKYKYYLNWGDNNSGNPYEISPYYLKKNWIDHTGNCVWFAWTFYLMCKGAGIKVNVVNGDATWKQGTYGHMWNTYKGKNIDCSSTAVIKYNKKKVVI